eukprot:comp17740_c0_seq1/m.17716 comp17740_c0_seq1/g.17716  ORF comp17740_c0_seq1/g.17716 comp17740_c0_seq1/m.17716 type:complete len:378 (-) comp17740_c0_seq1:694-1827(-)
MVLATPMSVSMWPTHTHIESMVTRGHNSQSQHRPTATNAQTPGENSRPVTLKDMIESAHVFSVEQYQRYRARCAAQFVADAEANVNFSHAVGFHTAPLLGASHCWSSVSSEASTSGSDISQDETCSALSASTQSDFADSASVEGFRRTSAYKQTSVDWMQDVLEEEKKPLRRELRLLKPGGRPFGASLCQIRGGTFVTYVEPASPAWRVGIQTGDRVDMVNNIFVNDRSTSPKMLIDLLRDSEEVEITICDTPMVEEYKLVKIDSDLELGLVYIGGETWYPPPMSAFGIALISKGLTIMRVNDIDVIGMEDNSVVKVLESEYRAKDLINLVCVPSRLGTFMNSVWHSRNGGYNVPEVSLWEAVFPAGGSVNYTGNCG